MTDNLSLVSSDFYDDILLYTLSFLEQMVDFKNIFTTNKRLYHLSFNSNLWRQVFQKYFPEELELYHAAFKEKPQALFKAIYLLRLNQFFFDFKIKTRKSEDYLLFKMMIKGDLAEIDARYEKLPLKLNRIYAYMMSENYFNEIDVMFNYQPEGIRQNIYSRAFLFCCEHNHVKKLHFILDRYLNFIDIEKIKNGLSYAAELGYTDSIKAILSYSNIKLSPEVVGQLFFTACDANREETAVYLFNHYAADIFDEHYGCVFELLCAKKNENLLDLFFDQFKKNIKLKYIINGLQSALEKGHLTLAEKLTVHFNKRLAKIDYQKMILFYLIEQKCLVGFAYLFNISRNVLSDDFLIQLLKSSCKNRAFSIIEFLLNQYSTDFPNYLNQKAKNMLNEAEEMPVSLTTSPTLIFSRPNDDVQLLCDNLHALKLESEFKRVGTGCFKK